MHYSAYSHYKFIWKRGTLLKYTPHSRTDSLHADYLWQGLNILWTHTGTRKPQKTRQMPVYMIGYKPNTFKIKSGALPQTKFDWHCSSPTILWVDTKESVNHWAAESTTLPTTLYQWHSYTASNMPVCIMTCLTDIYIYKIHVNYLYFWVDFHNMIHYQHWYLARNSYKLRDFLGFPVV